MGSPVQSPAPARRRTPSPRRGRPPASPAAAGSGALSRSAAQEALVAVAAGRVPPHTALRPSCQDTLYFEVRVTISL